MKNTAGLLTRFFLSRRLPEKTSVAYRHKGFQQKLTAAGLSGIFTRFPFKRYDSAPLFSRKIRNKIPFTQKKQYPLRACAERDTDKRLLFIRCRPRF
jgi:hypothetical protein